jgi:hypothetical protein
MGGLAVVAMAIELDDGLARNFQSNRAAAALRFDHPLLTPVPMTKDLLLPPTASFCQQREAAIALSAREACCSLLTFRLFPRAKSPNELIDIDSLFALRFF